MYGLVIQSHHTRTGIEGLVTHTVASFLSVTVHIAVTGSMDLRSTRLKDFVPVLRSGGFGNFRLFERTYGHFDIDSR